MVAPSPHRPHALGHCELTTQQCIRRGRCMVSANSRAGVCMGGGGGGGGERG